jgi:hypothetical protein
MVSPHLSRAERGDVSCGISKGERATQGIAKNEYRALSHPVVNPVVLGTEATVSSERNCSIIRWL